MDKQNQPNDEMLDDTGLTDEALDSVAGGIEMQRVLITSVSLGNSSSDDIPDTFTVSLNFEKGI